MHTETSSRFVHQPPHHCFYRLCQLMLVILFNVVSRLFFIGLRLLLQENLLLDDEQNLKLIDFGLCAQPKVRNICLCTVSEQS